MRLRRFFCFIFVAALLCLIPLSMASAANQTDTRTMAMINKPGVVLVYTTWSADVVMPEYSLDQVIYDDMDANIQDQIDSGTMNPNDPSNFVTAYLNLLTEWFPYYAIDTGKTIDQPVSVSNVGTGFIVTPDGYILTNAHVVSTDEDALKVQFASDAASEIVNSDVQGLVDNLTSTFGVSPTDTEVQNFADMYYNFYAQSMTVSNLKGDFECLMGNVTPGSDVSAKALTMDLRKKGEVIPGKDIAILKIDKTNLPTVTLGDDTALKTGDQVYAMGYPAVTTVSSDILNIEQAISEPTLTSGIISAKKEMSGGWSILQTDADIHGGNSGGPLFNSNGEVVGINTFGMIDESGSESSGSNFAIPISIAKEFLNEINVKPSESDFTKQYKQAVDLYNNGDYKGALEILRSINEINPGYPVIADLLSETSSKALTQTGPAQTGSALPVQSPGNKSVSGPAQNNDNSFNIMLVIIIVVVAAAVVVVVLLITRRKKNPPPPGAPAAMVPPTPPPVVPPAQAPIVPPTPAPAVTPAPIVPPPAAPAQAVLSCPNCGVPVKPGAKFCPKCGTQLALECKNCNAKLLPGAKFFPECGAKTIEE